jgi:HK97 family phage portal protein
MALFDFFRRRGETRATLIDNELVVPVSAVELINGFGSSTAASGVNVTIDKALGVPAIFAAVNFIASSIAGLPLNVYKRTPAGRVRVTTGIATVLHDAVNDELSSFDWRKHMMEQVLTGGRAFTYIERTPAGRVVNLFPLDPSKTKVTLEGGRKFYTFKSESKSTKYEASEIIDLAFMLKADGLSWRSPIMTNKNDIGLAIAATEYGSRFFQNGGIPAFAVTGNFQAPGAMARAADDLAAAVRKASKEDRQALVLPAGLEIKSLGNTAKDSQLLELLRFCIEQAARIYSLPPVFLQDLTHGTFNNSEQQDLHLVKHTLKRWAEQFEQEINLKLFGRQSNKTFAELNLDGVMRGDFKTRMDGYATAIQNGLLKPNEARAKENLPDDEAGNALMIQGATVPIANQLAAPKPAGDTTK